MAGRPKKADKYGGHIAQAEDLIADRLPSLIDNLFSLADGIEVQEETPNGPRIYSRPPDRQANEYLVNRIMGKPIDRRELTGKDGEPLISAEAQRRMLGNERALGLACELDELVSGPPSDDPGRLRPPGERGQVGLPETLGDPESEALRSRGGPDQAPGDLDASEAWEE
jgi:hypothetical protein